MDYRYDGQQVPPCISLAGRIEADDAHKLKSPFLQVITAGHKSVELDFAGVVYIGSSGIATLLQAHKSLAARGVSLRIVNTPVNIASLFKSLKLDKMLDLSLGR
jgi:anti-anti-sigma factor